MCIHRPRTIEFDVANTKDPPSIVYPKNHSITTSTGRPSLHRTSRLIDVMTSDALREYESVNNILSRGTEVIIKKWLVHIPATVDESRNVSNSSQFKP